MRKVELEEGEEEPEAADDVEVEVEEWDVEAAARELEAEVKNDEAGHVNGDAVAYGAQPSTKPFLMNLPYLAPKVQAASGLGVNYMLYCYIMYIDYYFFLKYIYIYMWPRPLGSIWPFPFYPTQTITDRLCRPCNPQQQKTRIPTQMSRQTPSNVPD